jgi:hypothetical protein
MHKARNKHGPDTATGIRMGWPRGPAYITGEPPPWMEIRYGPPCSAASRGDPPGERWRSGTGYSGLPSHVPRWPLSVVEVPTSLVPQMERWRSGTGKRDGPDGFARGPDKVWPPGILKSEKRRRWRPRDFVTLGQPDESPPGIVNKQIINNIDSTVRSRLPARGRLKHGVLKDIYCLTARGMPEQIIKKPRRDAIPRKLPAGQAIFESLNN